MPDATVEYGLDPSYGESVYSDTPMVVGGGSLPLFQVGLDGLSPGTVYHYRVTDGSFTTDDRAFTTAVDPGDSFLFCAYGDNRRGGVSWAEGAVAQAMVSEGPDFVLNSGDIVQFDVLLGVEMAMEWQNFFLKSTPLISSSPLFAIRGNHDEDGSFFAKYMDNPTGASGNEYYYSFDYGNAHFIGLDSTLEECSGAQLAFLEAELVANEGSGPLFAYFHHPPFSNGSHGGSGSTHDCWAPLLQEYGVDVVFNGHDHLYTRYGTYPVDSPVPGINGVHYVVTGGGGAPLYQPNFINQAPIVYTEAYYHYVAVHVSGDTIELTAKRPDGTVMDSFIVDAAANDGQFDRSDPLPPQGDGGPCGTVPVLRPGDSPKTRLAVGVYLLPVAFMLLLRRRVRG
jgi:hypothetical protein